jgi:acyl-coenzyme A thioesterase PaaI-like protein
MVNVEAVNSDGPEEVYAEAAETLEEVVKGLRKQPRRMRSVGFRQGKEEFGRREFDFGMVDLSPVSGLANPLAPPLRVQRKEEKRAMGTVVFPGSVRTGAGWAHPGYVAASLDEVFGAVLAWMGQPIMTGILDVRFLRPCPLEEEVRIDGWVRREIAGAIFTEARVEVAAGPVAEANAVFFVVGEDQYRRFAEERNRKLPIG